MGNTGKWSRRQFLGKSAGALGGALATPYFLTAARAQDTAKPAPSDRVIMGAVGLGGQGRYDMSLAMPYADFVAVCDVDANHARDAREAAGGKADVYGDYRRLIERKDIQAVLIATPDHWHTKIAVEAMQAGKDIYCEKPLTLTIDEGKILCKVTKETGRVFQVGTQQRSEHERRFINAVAIIRSGRLGKITKITCGINNAPSSPPIPVVPAPKELDWNMWLGQAPLVDYRLLVTEKPPEGFAQKYYSRCHYEFRWWYEYSGGKMTDWGAHHVDVALWAMGFDGTGPSSVKPLMRKFPQPYENGYPTLDDRYNVATDFHVVAQFGDTEVHITSEGDNGVLFEGDKGRIFVNREKLTGKPVEELSELVPQGKGPDGKEQPPVSVLRVPENLVRQAYKGHEPTGHMANFIDCIKSRQEPISDVWSHHRSISTCHLANIALRLDREIKWDPVKEAVIGDPVAEAFTSREQRQGFEIVA